MTEILPKEAGYSKNMGCRPLAAHAGIFVGGGEVFIAAASATFVVGPGQGVCLYSEATLLESAGEVIAGNACCGGRFTDIYEAVIAEIGCIVCLIKEPSS